MPKRKKAAAPKAKPPKPAHRPIEEIRRAIANSPAQALPALHAELKAAEEAERRA